MKNKFENAQKCLHDRLKQASTSLPLLLCDTPNISFKFIKFFKVLKDEHKDLHEFKLYLKPNCLHTKNLISCNERRSLSLRRNQYQQIRLFEHSLHFRSVDQELALNISSTPSSFSIPQMSFRFIFSNMNVSYGLTSVTMKTTRLCIMD